mmetsp:Transcript_14171/g.41574  ORF Transcript_14171/g.41574 Transcript_14171/m.41574 type:complete len:95 (+) Transcript_14171:535-819(+)
MTKGSSHSVSINSSSSPVTSGAAFSSEALNKVENLPPSRDTNGPRPAVNDGEKAAANGLKASADAMIPIRANTDTGRSIVRICKRLEENQLLQY